MNIEVKCPVCHSRDIVGYDVVEVTAKISGWKKTEHGIEPEWCGTSDPHWDSQVPKYADTPYSCNDCQRVWAGSELEVVE